MPRCVTVADGPDASRMELKSKPKSGVDDLRKVLSSRTSVESRIGDVGTSLSRSPSSGSSHARTKASTPSDLRAVLSTGGSSSGGGSASRLGRTNSEGEESPTKSIPFLMTTQTTKKSDTVPSRGTATAKQLGPARYDCALCEVSFRSTMGLLNHEESRPHSANVHKYQTKSQSELSRLAGEREFRCAVCNTMTVSFSSYLTHLSNGGPDSHKAILRRLAANEKRLAAIDREATGTSSRRTSSSSCSLTTPPPLPLTLSREPPASADGQTSHTTAVPRAAFRDTKPKVKPVVKKEVEQPNTAHVPMKDDGHSVSRPTTSHVSVAASPGHGAKNADVDTVTTSSSAPSSTPRTKKPVKQTIAAKACTEEEVAVPAATEARPQRVSRPPSQSTGGCREPSQTHFAPRPVSVDFDYKDLPSTTAIPPIPEPPNTTMLGLEDKLKVLQAYEKEGKQYVEKREAEEKEAGAKQVAVMETAADKAMGAQSEHDKELDQLYQASLKKVADKHAEAVRALEKDREEKEAMLRQQWEQEKKKFDKDLEESMKIINTNIEIAFKSATQARKSAMNKVQSNVQRIEAIRKETEAILTMLQQQQAAKVKAEAAATANPEHPSTAASSSTPASSASTLQPPPRPSSLLAAASSSTADWHQSDMRPPPPGSWLGQRNAADSETSTNGLSTSTASTTTTAAETPRDPSPKSKSQSIILLRIDEFPASLLSCQHLFNFFCVYANPIKIRTLSSTSAYVELDGRTGNPHTHCHTLLNGMNLRGHIVACRVSKSPMITGDVRDGQDEQTWSKNHRHHRIKHSYVRPVSTLFAVAIPPSWTERMLDDVFSGAKGCPEPLRINYHKHTGNAHITFKSTEDAVTALMMVNGTNGLKLLFSSSPSTGSTGGHRSSELESPPLPHRLTDSSRDPGPTTTSSASVLEPGWKLKWDPKTRCHYYENAALGLTSWDPPSETSPRKSSSSHRTRPRSSRSRSPPRRDVRPRMGRPPLDGVPLHRSRSPRSSRALSPSPSRSRQRSRYEDRRSRSPEPRRTRHHRSRSPPGSRSQGPPYSVHRPRRSVSPPHGWSLKRPHDSESVSKIEAWRAYSDNMEAARSAERTLSTVDAKHPSELMDPNESGEWASDENDQGDGTGETSAKPTLDLKIERPHEHSCPVSLDVMTNPVLIVSCGCTVEHEVAVKWFEAGKKTCPACTQPSDGKYTANKALKIMIQDWNEKHAATSST